MLSTEHIVPVWKIIGADTPDNELVTPNFNRKKVLTTRRESTQNVSIRVLKKFEAT